MTDESKVPMNDQPANPWASADQPTADAPTVPSPPTEPTQPNPQNPQNLSWPPPQTPAAPPPAGGQAPPTWGSAPQGWPPPPVPPVTPPTTPPGPSFDQAPPPPPYGYNPGPQPGEPTNWNYGYGPQSWGPPPGARRESKGARRVVAAVAVAVLALASAGVGAAISAAVHSTDTNTASSPFTGNGSNGSNGAGNGFGLGNGGFSLGNGNGNGSSSGAGTGATPSAKVIAKVNPAVVDIYTTIDNGQGQGEAAGTGMVITPSGEVLTNNHVIDGAKTIRVQIIGTGTTHTAKVVGYSVVDDVALLKIDDVSDLATVHPAEGSAEVGDAVVAIGNAGGRGGTPAATAGSVTALDQKVTAGDAGSAKSETLHGMIQISAPIEPGDSGGPLADSDGNIIGMNTAAAQSDDFFGQTGSSTAFAIPIDKALEVVHQIEAGNDSDTVHVGERGILGVQVRNVADNPASGALIAGVQSSGPADSAGIGEGDVITSVGGKTVTNASDLTSLMFPYHPDDKVQIGWVDQSGQTHRASIGLVAGPPD